MRLVHKYNDLRKKLSAAIERGSAPQASIAPVAIDTKQLFSLDVDSALWNDVGLEHQDDDQQVPLWMGNEQVRNGIRSYLDYCRCQEELARLQHEIRNLIDWYKSEWGGIVTALASSQGMLSLMPAYAHFDFVQGVSSGFQHALKLRHTELIRLLTVWWKDIATLPLLPKDVRLDSWGPSVGEVMLTLQSFGPIFNGIYTSCLFSYMH